MATNISGVINLPEGIKEAGKRVDFKPDDYAFLVETKGYRVAWSRAALCPCAKVTAQINVDPNCSLCEGSGWFYFAPTEATIEESITGELTAIQKSIIQTNKAGVIRAIMTNLTRLTQPYDKIGNWVEGETVATVRWQNQIGYYDKLVNLDASTIYAQILDVTGTESTLSLKYPAVDVNILRSFSKEYICGEDFTIEDGAIAWRPNMGPTSATRLSVQYAMHPTFIVTEHPHVIRTTLVAFKSAVKKTPLGNPSRLPLQAKVLFEPLVS